MDLSFARRTTRDPNRPFAELTRMMIAANVRQSGSPTARAQAQITTIKPVADRDALIALLAATGNAADGVPCSFAPVNSAQQS